jgi:hypothetical protein
MKGLLIHVLESDVFKPASDKDVAQRQAEKASKEKEYVVYRNNRAIGTEYAETEDEAIDKAINRYSYENWGQGGALTPSEVRAEEDWLSGGFSAERAEDGKVIEEGNIFKPATPEDVKQREAEKDEKLGSKWYSIRVIRGHDEEEARENLIDEVFEENDPVCDIIIPASDVAIKKMPTEMAIRDRSGV